MAVLVIAGSGRGAGKTAVGCALVAALPELQWVAVKATPNPHDGLEAVWEEADRDSGKDTGRYLAAGARRSFLVSASETPSSEENSDRLPGLLSLFETWRLSAGVDALLVESGQIEPAAIARIGGPAVCLVVLGAGSEWKVSVWDRIAFADAVVPASGLSLEDLPLVARQKPTFCLPQGDWSSPELVMFVRARLLASK